jgi:hypothetical protein
MVGGGAFSACGAIAQEIASVETVLHEREAGWINRLRVLIDLAQGVKAEVRSRLRAWTAMSPQRPVLASKVEVSSDLAIIPSVPKADTRPMSASHKERKFILGSI